MNVTNLSFSAKIYTSLSFPYLIMLVGNMKRRDDVEKTILILFMHFLSSLYVHYCAIKSLFRNITLIYHLTKVGMVEHFNWFHS